MEALSPSGKSDQGERLGSGVDGRFRCEDGGLCDLGGILMDDCVEKTGGAIPGKSGAGSGWNGLTMSDNAAARHYRFWASALVELCNDEGDRCPV